MPPSSSTSSSSEFAKLGRRGLVLLALVVLLDQGLGRLAQVLYDRTRDGDTGETINALLERPHDIVIFGSSRAESHYIPSILRDATGASVYNAGFKGSNIVYDYGLEQLLLDHYVPKLIIYDFSSFSVQRSTADPYEKLYPLYPFWRNAHVWSLISEGGLRARIPFLSRLYPYSSKIHSLLIFNLIGHRADAEDGYNGNTAVMPDGPVGPLRVAREDYDPRLTSYLAEFVEAAHRSGAALVFVESPRRARGSFPLPDGIAALLGKYGFPVIDFDDARFPESTDHRFFRDPSHLNDRGAKIFSRAVGEQVATLYPDLASRVGGPRSSDPSPQVGGR